MNDLRFACRSLAKSPGFTAVAVVTLALAIGVNTTLFSGLNAFLFTPLPYPEADRIVRISRSIPQSSRRPLSPAEFFDLAADRATFAHIAAYTYRNHNLTLPGEPAERVVGVSASADFFSVYGVAPMLGRSFAPDEDRPGRASVAVVGYEFWRNQLGGDRAALGRKLRVDGEPVTVIGVMPPGFDTPILWDRVALWRPLVLSDRDRQNRDSQWLRIAARLHAGISRPTAQAAIDVLGARLAAEYPATNAAASFQLLGLRESVMRPAESQLTWLMMGLAVFVVLIGCANLANVQLARAIGRSHEHALRIALGATRGRMIRLLLAETCLLSAAGGALAWLLSCWGKELLAHLISRTMPAPIAIPLDGRVLAFTFALATATALVVGVAPAWIASRCDVHQGLERGTMQLTPNRTQRGLRHLFVIAELALAFVLLAGAGMMLGGVRRRIAAGPGWRTENLLRADLMLSSSRYRSAAERRTFLAQIHDRLGALPQVERVTCCWPLPLWGFSSSRSFVVENGAPTRRGHEPQANLLCVDADFFPTLGIRLQQGRAFSASDGPDGPPVAVINTTLARRFWPGENPIGKRIGSANTQRPDWIEVVGVVDDVRLAIPTGERDTPFQLFRPIGQSTPETFTVALRTAESAESLGPVLKQIVAELDPDLPVQRISTVQQTVEFGMADISLAGEIVSAFAVLGLLLASVGIYGVMAGAVAQRRREIGIRMALGASTRAVLQMVLRTGAGLALLGTMLGLVAATVLALTLKKVMPDFPTGDSPTIAAVAVGLFVIALLACWIPARRATRIDPLEALRAE